MTEEPNFLLDVNGVILYIIFFPIGIFVLLFATIKYLADWMCYNFQWPRVLCYIFALVLGPFFLPLVIISGFFRMFKDKKDNKKDKLIKKNKK